MRSHFQSVTSRTICLNIFFLILNLRRHFRPFLDLDATADVLIISYIISIKNNHTTIMLSLFGNSDAKKAELIKLGLPEEAA